MESSFIVQLFAKFVDLGYVVEKENLANRVPGVISDFDLGPALNPAMLRGYQQLSFRVTGGGN